jgi:hypothetical protein
VTQDAQAPFAVRVDRYHWRFSDCWAAPYTGGVRHQSTDWLEAGKQGQLVSLTLIFAIVSAIDPSPIAAREQAQEGRQKA